MVTYKLVYSEGEKENEVLELIKKFFFEQAIVYVSIEMHSSFLDIVLAVMQPNHGGSTFSLKSRIIN